MHGIQCSSIILHDDTHTTSVNFGASELFPLPSFRPPARCASGTSRGTRQRVGRASKAAGLANGIIQALNELSGGGGACVASVSSHPNNARTHACDRILAMAEADMPPFDVASPEEALAGLLRNTL